MLRYYKDEYIKIFEQVVDRKQEYFSHQQQVNLELHPTITGGVRLLLKRKSLPPSNKIDFVDRMMTSINLNLLSHT